MPQRMDTSDVTADIVSLRPNEVVEGGIVYRQPPAPPLDQLDVAAYDLSGAKAGAKSGYTILTAHSYRAGWSLGNELRRSLELGDVIKLRAGHKAACYRVTRRETFGESDYPNVYASSSPQLVVTVCSDYDPTTRVWRKRTVWYAEPIK